MARQTLGDFEQQILLTILRLGGESYSVPIVLELEERTGREVSQAAVYVALRRLEDRGLLTSRMDDHAVKDTGRIRRYFELTPPALERCEGRAGRSSNYGTASKRFWTTPREANVGFVRHVETPAAHRALAGGCLREPSRPVLGAL